MKYILIMLLTVITGCVTNNEKPISEINKLVFSDPSCLIEDAPSEAGEMIVNRRLIKAFPRRMNISSSFNGCQTVWMGTKKTYRLVIVDGQVRTTLFDKSQCNYKNGHLLSNNPTSCSEQSPEIMATLAAGCLTSFGNPTGQKCLPDSNESNILKSKEVSPNSRAPTAILFNCLLDDIHFFDSFEMMGEKRAMVRCKNGQLYVAQLGNTVSNEQAKIISIADQKIILLDSRGNKKEINASNPNH